MLRGIPEFITVWMKGDAMSEYHVLYEGLTGPEVPYTGVSRSCITDRFSVAFDEPVPIVSAAPAASKRELTSSAVRFRAESAKSKNVVGIVAISSVVPSWRRLNGLGSGNRSSVNGAVYVSDFLRKVVKPSQAHPPTLRLSTDHAAYSPAAGRLKISKLIAELPPRTFPLKHLVSNHVSASRMTYRF